MTRPFAISGATSRKPARDVFIGQAVKSVSAHALRIEMLRDRIVVGDRAVAAVKRGIEAGDLREVRAAGEQSTRIGARLLG